MWFFLSRMEVDDDIGDQQVLSEEGAVSDEAGGVKSTASPNAECVYDNLLPGDLKQVNLYDVSIRF